MESIRSEKEIRERILDLEKQMGYRYTSTTKELIQAKIDELYWVLNSQ
jgi:predicted DNA-binding protein